MSLRSVVHFTVTPEKREELLRMFREDVDAARRDEPGAERLELYASVDDEHRFVFVEQWRSREDLAAHGELPLVRAIWAAFRDPEFMVEPWKVWRCETESGPASAEG